MGWYDRVVDEREAEYRLERLKSGRIVWRKDLGISDAVSARVDEIARTRRSVGGIGRAWAAVLPDALAGHVEKISVSRGVLTVRSVDDGGRYELDRWLRSGGRQALIEAATTTVRRVKVV